MTKEKTSNILTIGVKLQNYDLQEREIKGRMVEEEISQLWRPMFPTMQPFWCRPYMGRYFRKNMYEIPFFDILVFGPRWLHYDIIEVIFSDFDKDGTFQPCGPETTRSTYLLFQSFQTTRWPPCYHRTKRSLRSRWQPSRRWEVVESPGEKKNKWTSRCVFIEAVVFLVHPLFLLLFWSLPTKTFDTILVTRVTKITLKWLFAIIETRPFKP